MYSFALFIIVSFHDVSDQHIPSRMVNSQYNSSVSQLDPKHQDACRPRVENSFGSTIVGTTSTDLLVDRRPFASVSDAAALFTGESGDRWSQAIDGDRSLRDSKHSDFVKSVPDGQSGMSTCLARSKTLYIQNGNR